MDYSVEHLHRLLLATRRDDVLTRRHEGAAAVADVQNVVFRQFLVRALDRAARHIELAASSRSGGILSPGFSSPDITRRVISSTNCRYTGVSCCLLTENSVIRIPLPLDRDPALRFPNRRPRTTAKKIGLYL